MIPSSLRFPRDFRRVLAQGTRSRRGGVTVVALPGSDTETRLGLVVGKAVGGAVTRNRVKRRLRIAAREIQWEQGMDYVILADRTVASAPFPELVGWLSTAATRVSR